MSLDHRKLEARVSRLERRMRVGGWRDKFLEFRMHPLDSIRRIRLDFAIKLSGRRPRLDTGRNRLFKELNDQGAMLDLDRYPDLQSMFSVRKRIRLGQPTMDMELPHNLHELLESQKAALNDMFKVEQERIRQDLEKRWRQRRSAGN